ncbi:hypothetical protein J6590_019732 [Homalodisca vitripennis]|nr:hypothetical protein J6590_019732 [Homalodisca vitripennis]
MSFFDTFEGGQFLVKLSSSRNIGDLRKYRRSDPHKTTLVFTREKQRSKRQKEQTETATTACDWEAVSEKGPRYECRGTMTPFPTAAAACVRRNLTNTAERFRQALPQTNWFSIHSEVQDDHVT